MIPSNGSHGHTIRDRKGTKMTTYSVVDYNLTFGFKSVHTFSDFTSALDFFKKLNDIYNHSCVLFDYRLELLRGTAIIYEIMG